MEARSLGLRVEGAYGMVELQVMRTNIGDCFGVAMGIRTGRAGKGGRGRTVLLVFAGGIGGIDRLRWFLLRGW